MLRVECNGSGCEVVCVGCVYIILHMLRTLYSDVYQGKRCEACDGGQEGGCCILIKLR